MNIYIHMEILSRELHSKLLLATLAAARGHEIILSDLEIILAIVSAVVSPTQLRK